jgi:hypothetical protein
MIVLEGLDSVPWDELEVAGVSEEPIPDLLRTIGTAPERDAIEAFHDVSWEILHQGSVYAATAPTVPFLAELLTVVGPVLRGSMLELLGSLAHCYDIDPDEEQRVEVRAAVTAQVDQMLPLLTDESAWTRYSAAYALSGCPDRASEVLPRLHERWAAELDPRVRAGIVMAAALLDRRTTLIKEGLAASQPAAVRAAAVLAAVRTGRRWPGAKAVAAVRDAWRDGDPFAAGDDSADGRWVPDWYPEAMEDLLDSLAPTDQPPILTALLNSGDPDVRLNAAVHAGTAIGERRSLRESLTTVLIPVLRDENGEVRLAAVDAIRRAGTAAGHAADDLAAAAGRDDEVGGQAVTALAELGDPRATERLLAHIRAGTAADDAGFALADAGTPATPELLDAVRRRLAALAGGAPNTRTIARIRDLRQQSQHGDPEPVGLLHLVTAWGPAAAPAAEELVALLRAERAVKQTADALAAIGPAAGDAAVPLLTTQRPSVESFRASAHRNETRLALARARWRLTGDPEPAIDEAWLHINHGGADGLAVELLTEIGEPAHGLLPRMRQAMTYWLTQDPEWYQSEQIAIARLVWQWTGDATAALAIAHHHLAELDPDLIGYGHVEAAILAVDLGDTGAVRTLTGVLADGRPYPQRLRAYRAMWRLTRDPDHVLTPIADAITADNPPAAPYWTDYLQLLTELGPAAAPILPALREFADRDERVVYFWPGQTPGIVDERTRAAIRTTVDTLG